MHVYTVPEDSVLSEFPKLTSASRLGGAVDDVGGVASVCVERWCEVMERLGRLEGAGLWWQRLVQSLLIAALTRNLVRP